MCWQYVTNVQMCCPIVTGEPKKGGGKGNNQRLDFFYFYFPFYFYRKEGTSFQATKQY